MPIRNNANLMHQVIERMDYMVRIMDSDNKIVYMNKKMRDEFGQATGRMCYEVLGKHGKCNHCISTSARFTGQPDAKDIAIDDRFYRVMASPVNLDGEMNYAIELFQDITDEKKMEIELLSNYKKLKDDINFAKHIQNRALPLDGVHWNTIRTDSLYVQSEDLGGDLFDILQLDENKSLIYISDVSGHGVKSSLLTIFLRQVIRGAKPDNIDIKILFNELLKSYNDLNVGSEQYLTILGGIYDKRTRVITFANAGHNCLPIIISKENNEVKEVEVMGMPICSLIKEANHESIKVKLSKGDRIVLYTDGISETFNRFERKEFGSDGIIEIIKKNLDKDGKTLAAKVIEGAKAFSDTPPIDDMAILVAEIL